MLPEVDNKRLTDLLKALIAIIEDETTRKTDEFNSIINEIGIITGPDLSSIPADLRKALGIAYGSTIAETNTAIKATYLRTTIGLLRTAVVIAKGSPKQIKKIDEYISYLENEISACEQSGEEATLDNLWKKTNRATDYVGLMIFRGYGDIKGEGFIFNRKEKEK